MTPKNLKQKKPKPVPNTAPKKEPRKNTKPQNPNTDTNPTPQPTSPETVTVESNPPSISPEETQAISIIEDTPTEAIPQTEDISPSLETQKISSSEVVPEEPPKSKNNKKDTQKQPTKETSQESTNISNENTKVQDNNVSGKPVVENNGHNTGVVAERNISNPYTFTLSTPLDPEITTGEQTFIEIDGTLFLKISPKPLSETSSIPVYPTWYSSLKSDFEIAKNPKKKKQTTNQPVAVTSNGSLIFAVNVPDFVQELGIVNDNNKNKGKKPTNYKKPNQKTKK